MVTDNVPKSKWAREREKFMGPIYLVMRLYRPKESRRATPAEKPLAIQSAEGAAVCGERLER